MIKDFIQLLLKPMATVSIGSRTYSGRNIQINGDTVFVDGVRQKDSLVAPVFITVTGMLNALMVVPRVLTSQVIARLWRL